MARKPDYVPDAVDRLEERVVLSHAVAARGLSVAVRGLAPRQDVLNARQQPVIAEIDQTFASFTSDYDNARATYFASILDVPNPSSATTSAFVLYTKQRVGLLANQIIGSFLQTPKGTAQALGQASTLKQLVSTKIVYPQGQAPPGSLENALLATIPPAGTSSATASLYSLSQDNAIESAQVAIINGVNLVKSGGSGSHSSQHK